MKTENKTLTKREGELDSSRHDRVHKKNKKWIILILIIPLISILLTAGTIFYNVAIEKFEDWKFQNYAKDFCSESKKYEPLVEIYDPSENESEILGIYFLISNQVIEENQAPSFVTCCEIYGYECLLIDCLLENKTDECIFVNLGNENKSDYRFLNFKRGDDDSVGGFLKFRYNFSDKEYYPTERAVKNE